MRKSIIFIIMHEIKQATEYIYLLILIIGNYLLGDMYVIGMICYLQYTLFTFACHRCFWPGHFGPILVCRT